CAAVYFFSLAVAFASWFFPFNDTATTELYTLSLHDALPIYLLHDRGLRGDLGRRHPLHRGRSRQRGGIYGCLCPQIPPRCRDRRSEEHTSELQSRENLVCRLLLEKKKNTTRRRPMNHEQDQT